MKKQYFPQQRDQFSLINSLPDAIESHLMHLCRLAGMQVSPACTRALAMAAHHATLMHFSRARIYFKKTDLLRVRDAQILATTTPDEIQASAVAAALSPSQTYRVLQRERRNLRGNK